MNDTRKLFKDTLNLPHTDFSIRAEPAKDDPALLKRWQDEQLYDKAMVLNEGNEKYILHVGPPYANGNIHLGHAYNFILKDIITKSRRMAGYHTPVKPGWDCHGLPIEIKVDQADPNLAPRAKKEACRAYAQKWVDVQREEFKQLGVVMDWDHPYITMAPSYEASTVKAFGSLFEKGFIERKFKTVAWCPACKTTLATAEIEYKERKDPSVYVLFDLDAVDAKNLFPEANGKPVSFLIWTTTPWTLPLNRAVMLHPSAEYSLVAVGDRCIIVGAALYPKIAALSEQPTKVLRTFPSSLFANSLAQHPFVEDLKVPIVFDESVGLNDGTACVHIAPGCGPIDYEVGVKNELEIYSPITADGKYTNEIQPRALADMPVADGQWWVLKRLKEVDKLWHKGSITHSYPHCWRSGTPLIFRATRQWFFNLDHHDIRRKLLTALEKITFIPERSKHFLKATVENRWEWCLSRQRTWGVPIPALVCTECGYGFTTSALIDQAARGIAKEGIEYWDEVNIEDLLPSKDNKACPECGLNDFKKESDILDVWFESGISHYIVLFNNPALAYPADLYLEGVDQHRAWFQSSLLTSMALEEKACTKAIMSHGFTVDAKGQKMSKSLGNVVAPQEVIAKIGTDGLRLWATSIGGDSDAIISEVLIKNVAEVYRKIRNTCRFLLSNLNDFDPTTDAMSIDRLRSADLYAVGVFNRLQERLLKAYKAGDLTLLFHELADYCATELSSFYLDISKDRLYVEKPDGYERRSAQTAYYYILDGLTRLMAPVLSFTAELVSDFYIKNKETSIHLLPFKTIENVVVDGPAWDQLKELRSTVLKAIEEVREQGLVKHSLEAQVTLFIDFSKPSLAELKLFTEQAEKQSFASLLKELLIVSDVVLAPSQEGLTATSMTGVYCKVEHAPGTKCPRCWHWEVTTNPDGLCARCQRVLSIT